MAIRGEEGRDSLRKASGSWQMSCDPEESEWGNPVGGQKTEDGRLIELVVKRLKVIRVKV